MSNLNQVYRNRSDDSSNESLFSQNSILYLFLTKSIELRILERASFIHIFVHNRQYQDRNGRVHNIIRSNHHIFIHTLSRPQAKDSKPKLTESESKVFDQKVVKKDGHSTI